MREVEAPDGYSKIDDVSFMITAAYDGNIPVVSVSNSAISVSNGVLSTTVVNTSSELFPGTGGMGTVIFIACGSVLIVGSVAWFVLRRRKESMRG